MSGQNQHITLLIEGMDCSNCALGITKSLQKKGMQKVYVDFATGEANFEATDPKLLAPAIASIKDLGYKVLDTRFGAEEKTGLSRIEKRFYFTLPFTIVLFFSHMLLPHNFILNQPYVQLALCIPVFIIGIIQFGKSAWSSIKAMVPNMDVLIFTGSSAAFIYSIAGMVLYSGSHELHNYLFFETTATIITLVLLGNVLEHRSVKQTTTALRDLTKLQVEKAKVLSLHLGKEVITEVDVKSITPGFILQVNTGDKVPADGEIIQGDASINESMLSGESMPLDKGVGAKVIAGTILVNGNFRMRVEQVGNKTVLAKIIELVKKAQQEKPDIQKLGDKISAIFVPVVLGISILTFVLSWMVFDVSFQNSMMHSIAVLVISCPCAMGLATPTAVMVGIGRAAKRGILIKGGNTLEEFAKIKIVAFDKTGTLTTGDLKIKEMKGTVSKPELKDILFQLEQHSSHPIARSLVAELQGTAALKKFKDIREEKGLGISAKDEEGNSYQIGSYRIASALTTDNTHSIYVVRNNELIALVDLQDELRNNASDAVEALNRQGIQTILVSGDSQQKSEEIGAKLGISKIYGAQLPEQKLELIAKLNAENAVAMVGDGVNDAPALAKASVGISLGNATQAAINSAQIILLKNNDLSSLAEAHLISKHTLITIKQNLFWAFAYNIVAIPIAAMGFLNPMVGALAMAFSDVIVIGNSVRLKTKKLK